jgi:hypothetical protein
VDVYKKVTGGFDFHYTLSNLADSCEHGNELSGSTKGEELLLVSHKAGSVRPIENLHYKNFKSNCIIF